MPRFEKMLMEDVRATTKYVLGLNVTERVSLVHDCELLVLVAGTSCYYRLQAPTTLQAYEKLFAEIDKDAFDSIVRDPIDAEARATRKIKYLYREQQEEIKKAELRSRYDKRLTHLSNELLIKEMLSMPEGCYDASGERTEFGSWYFVEAKKELMARLVDNGFLEYIPSWTTSEFN